MKLSVRPNNTKISFGELYVISIPPPLFESLFIVGCASIGHIRLYLSRMAVEK